VPRICRATTSADLTDVRPLFRQYIEHLDFDLDFQDVEREIQSLPGPYARPKGIILLARLNSTAVGVVATKPLDEPGVCEMKRLYVCPEVRGQGIGRALGEAILDEARERGYDTMRLDTVASMKPARSLYRSLGFTERGPYYHNPLDGVVFMERSL